MIRTGMDARSREIYLEGLKRYRDRGVRILIDGREADESSWNKIFEVREDGSFYMGDYVLEDEPLPDTAAADGKQALETGVYPGQNAGGSAVRTCGALRESPAPYGQGARRGGKRLKEIRFDRVYHR